MQRSQGSAVERVARYHVEHAFQAAKTIDPTERACIRMSATPSITKRLGRKVSLRPDWEEVKTEVMLQLVRQKFNGTDLGAKLLATGNEPLEEVNRWGDTLWGTTGGVGQNHLGRILMQVREELRGANT